jgi:hypothetical protein
VDIEEIPEKKEKEGMKKKDKNDDKKKLLKWGYGRNFGGKCEENVFPFISHKITKSYNIDTILKYTNTLYW